MTFFELQKTCRTYRKFEQRQIPDDVFTGMLECARTSSCAGNLQNLRYYLVKSQDTVEAVQPYLRWAAYLPPEQGYPEENEQPVAFIAITKKGRAGSYSDVDAGISAKAIVSCAWDDGVGSCIMAGFKSKEIKELLSIPDDEVLLLVIALGYPLHKSSVTKMKDGDVKYYIDDDGNYCVPKRDFNDIVKIF